RMPAGAGEDPVRAPARIPRYRRPLWLGRRILRASRRLAVVRPQRGARPALSVPRLEIRRDRPVHGRPYGTGRERFLQEDQLQALPPNQARPVAVAVGGPGGEAPATA